jgi:hypothetical protein
LSIVGTVIGAASAISTQVKLDVAAPAITAVALRNHDEALAMS